MGRWRLYAVDCQATEPSLSLSIVLQLFTCFAVSCGRLEKEKHPIRPRH